MDGDSYRVQIASYTHGNVNDVVVSKEYLGKGDRVLIIDDFLARGNALEGLIQIVSMSGAELVGAGIVIEKAYQDGGEKIRARGVRVESLARIASMSEEDGVVFCD